MGLGKNTSPAKNNNNKTRNDQFLCFFGWCFVVFSLLLFSLSLSLGVYFCGLCVSVVIDLFSSVCCSSFFLFFKVQIRTSGLHRAIHLQTGVSNCPWTAKERLSLSVGIVPVQQLLGSSAKLLDWLVAWQNGAGYLLLTARKNSWHGKCALCTDHCVNRIKAVAVNC